MVQVSLQAVSELVLPAQNVPLWLSGIEPGRAKEDVKQIEKAAYFAIEAHQGQTRVSGEDYVNHTFAVAAIAHELGLDKDSIIAALLHDTVEDTDVTLVDIEKQFGTAVMQLVDGVTKMEVIKEFVDHHGVLSKQDAKAENLRKMMLAMVEDARVVLIKLCDRLHNMRTLQSLKPEKQKRIAKETLEIFAPLANRLGVWQIKWELEDLSFRYLESDTYKNIAGKLSERRVDREEYINNIVSELKDLLKQEGITSEVKGRPKHIFSIWNKMQKKNLDFEHIFDVRAVRILVDSVQDCYAALGLIHTKWKYIAGEFDDYIATPKENNYKSIHTAVIGPHGQAVEVQIRTHDMHEYNELGIAAHWRYKEGSQTIDEAVNNKILWLRQLLEWKDEVADASEFVDRLKDEVFQDRVYVFTPNGKVVDLPFGATPLDFAYAIHTEVGHKCRGAKVNGRMVQLTQELNTGERVEIITAKNGKPSLDWLNSHQGYIKTRRARAGIQHWFRHENRDETITHGKAVLTRELERMNLQDVNLERLAQNMSLESDDLYFKLADGSIKPSRVAVMAQKMLQPVQQDDEQLPPNVKIKTALRAKNESTTSNIHVNGVGNLLNTLAKCCRPVPGDLISGYITRGSGITIHRAACPNISYHKKQSPERVLEVEWGVKQETTYPMSIVIDAFDRKGLLRDIAAVFADEKINLLEMSTRTNARDQSVQMFVLAEIPGVEVMSQLLYKLEQLPNIQGVRRKT